MTGLWVKVPFLACPKLGDPDSYGFGEVMGLGKYGLGQCAGIGGGKADAFEVMLKTNTILTHSLEPGFIYYLSGKLIAMNNGSIPVLSYFENSVVRVCEASDTQPNFKSKTGAVGMGHVAKREEVVGSNEEGGNRLEVEIVHHDWDVQERCHQRFLVKYIIPSAKNLLKTHTLYVVGREAEIAGNLVDFDVESNMIVVMFALKVSTVSLTSGHLVGRMVPVPSGSDSPSPRKGLNLLVSSFSLAGKHRLIEILDSVKPSPKKDAIPRTPVTPKGFGVSTDDPKGKRRASDAENDNGEDQSGSEKSDAMEIEEDNPPKAQATRATARKAILQAAAKRMKRFCVWVEHPLAYIPARNAT
ncbi:hypothetical protein PSHT_05011 [Puccinia striiformis]|uniref:Uncharacterized protein n=1 Tax=Puccinia striiformis TaxID=27350 RepID=A0A2S4WBH5_9BASI|nr:hypothetical protein PSHT_05011 [Puccinia striiformis]